MTQAVHSDDGWAQEDWELERYGQAMRQLLVVHHQVDNLTGAHASPENWQPYVRHARRRAAVWNFARRCNECDLDFISLNDYIVHQAQHDEEIEYLQHRRLYRYLLGLIKDLPGIDHATILQFCAEEEVELGYLDGLSLTKVLKKMARSGLIFHDGPSKFDGWFPA